MIRIARERIADLFGLAATEARRADPTLPQRYVTLARRIGTRYNVRLPVGYRDLYCRGCSAYWVEGRTLRTRLRSGHRVQTCLVCGRIRRVRLRRSLLRPSTAGLPSGPEPAPAEAFSEEEGEADLEFEDGE